MKNKNKNFHLSMDNKVFYSLIATVIICFLGFVIYGNVDTSQAWHSSDQILFTNETCRIITGHDCGYDVDTIINAYTLCGDDEFLRGDGSCIKESDFGGTTPTSTNDLVYGQHSSDQCTALSGTVQTDGSDKFCRFNQANCPTGWAQFKEWSATSARTCSTSGCTSKCGENGCCCDGNRRQCTTGSHSFSNVAMETCIYDKSKCVAFSPCGGCLNPSTCYATYTARGCY